MRFCFYRGVSKINSLYNDCVERTEVEVQKKEEKKEKGKLSSSISLKFGQLCELLGLKPYGVHVIVGGPPCQGWSKVGRGKIRSLGKAGQDLLLDPRNTLYRRFIELVSYLRPKVCVMENVPGMISIENQNIAQVVKVNFEEARYNCTYSLVNARWFGVPQDRLRLIFIH